MGIAATKIAVLFVVYEVFGLLTNIYAGFFINRFGYKKAFIISLALHTLASFGYALMFLGPEIFMVLLINALRAFRGIAKELIKTTSASYCRVIADTHLQSHILLGGKETLKGVGFFVGGLLISFVSFQMSFVILGAITLLFMVLSIFSIEDFREKERISYKGFFNCKYHMTLLALIQAFLYAGRDIWLVIALPIYMTHIGVSSIYTAGVLAIGLIIFGLVQPLTGLFVKSTLYIRSVKVKNKWYYEDIMTLASVFLMVIPLLMIIGIENVWFIFGLVLVYSVISGFATAPHNFLHIRFARKHRVSLDIAFYKTISQVGKVIAVIASGVIYDFFGIKGCLIASFIALFITTIVSQLLVINFKEMKARKQIEHLKAT
jgi:MFS family permease